MSDPIYVSELARETEQQILRKLAGKCPERDSSFVELIQFALSKLAAEKDAERNILESRILTATGWNILDSRTTVQVVEDVVADLARHVAALKVAREVIKAAPHDKGCLQNWCDETRPCTCWKSAALQRIKELP